MLQYVRNLHIIKGPIPHLAHCVKLRYLHFGEIFAFFFFYIFLSFNTLSLISKDIILVFGLKLLEILIYKSVKCSLY